MRDVEHATRAGGDPAAVARIDDDLAARHAARIRQWIWRDFANLTLGVWLLTSPVTLGYTTAAMTWNDVIAGALVSILSFVVMRPRFDRARWGLALVGCWLLVAPLVLWTPDPAAYANGTLVGSLIIAFSVLIPDMPGRRHFAVVQGIGPDKPPGWTYNPSGWFQRGPIIAMALVGMFGSRYLAAYQLGHIDSVWDPVFGDGTRRVLESDVSKGFPVSDAGLGAVAYMLEALSGFMGGRDRWRTMPWMVALFGIMVVPLGVVSIVLVMLQPISVGAWCFICLFTAGAMLIMVAPAMDEIVAMGQFMAGARREGQPLWRVFWVGGTLRSYEEGRVPTADTPEEPRGPIARTIQALDLGNVPWTLLPCTALGLWVMAAPAVLGTTGVAADIDYLIGALIVTWSVIAYGEIIRPARLLNVPMGAVLIAGAWLAEGHTVTSAWADVAVGVAVALLSLPRGRIDEQFASWNRVLRW